MLVVREGFPRRWMRGGHSAGISIRIGDAQRSARAQLPAPRTGCLESAAGSPTYTDQAIKSSLIRDSGTFHSRTQVLEIHNILNWREVMSSGEHVLVCIWYHLRGDVIDVFLSGEIRKCPPPGVDTCEVPPTTRPITHGTRRSMGSQSVPPARTAGIGEAKPRHRRPSR